MSESDSDGDELFYYPGRDEIQKNFEKRLKESTSVIHTTIKTIFESDDENDTEEVKNTEVVNSHIPENEMTTKRAKYDAAAVIAAIDKASKEKAEKMMKGQSIASKIKREVKRLSDNLDRSRIRQEKRRQLIASMKAEIEDNPQLEEKEEVSKINILQGKEKEKALRSEYTNQENEITLVLQISVDGSVRKEVIRLDRDLSLNEIAKVLPQFGCKRGMMSFDGETLRKTSTANSLDMEDGDIIDIES